MKNQEIELLDDIIYKVYSIENFDAMRKKVLASLPFLVPCFAGCFYLANPEDRYTLEDPIFFGPIDESVQQYLSLYQEYDQSRWNFRASSPNAFIDSPYLEEERGKNSPLYLGVYKKNRIFYQISVTLIHDETFYGVIALFRQEQEQDFTEDDRWKLNLLSAHLSYRLFIRENEMSQSPVNLPSALPSYDKLVNEYKLTLREIDVVYELLRGTGKQEICEKFFISQNTLKKHTMNIYKKLGINSWRELYQLLH